jgi:HK97 family phage major capsid protein
MVLDKLAALTYVTEEMLQDVTALDAYVSDIVSQELAYKLDDAGIRGTGAGMPLGLLNAAATISVAKEAGQVAGTIVWENLLKMRMRMKASSRANMVWYVNADTEYELATMAFVVGTGGVPVYLPAGGASSDGYDRLFGRPVIPIEQCSTVGTVGDIIGADMSQYMVIEKGGINRATSIHVRFAYEESAFRFSLRTNGGPGPNWSAPLTPANGSNTVSPFVTLATRA